ncbi:hypothetical protein MPL1032_210073 [Mesorhizobium plurifarium]|uniref:Uncharacterized protein n=1 Tax=Mesorhizobium plurifarium TaxID=69974 RepID=A0A0K2VYM5_MESPL|nr:hypothetical protein MPL1032_210073 [Mesorhizobium plurifarium]
MSSCILVDIAGKRLCSAPLAEASLSLRDGLERQRRQHQPDAAGDQDGRRKRFPMALERRRSPFPIVTHTRSLPKAQRIHSLLRGRKATAALTVDAITRHVHIAGCLTWGIFDEENLRKADAGEA